MKGDYESALSRLDQELFLHVQRSDILGMAMVHDAKARVYMTFGMFHDASEELKRALSLCSGSGTATEATILQNLGKLRGRQGFYGEARDLLSRALSLYYAVEAEAEDLAVCHLNLSGANLRLGDFKACLHHCKQALPRYQGLDHHHGVISVWLIMAEALEGLGHGTEAAEYSKTALQLAKKINDIGGQHLAHMRLASLYLQEQRIVEARRHLEHCITLADPREPFKMSQIHAMLADSFMAQGDTKTALSHYERALGFVRRMRGALPTGGERVSLFKNTVDLYQATVKCSVAQGLFSRAFEYVEESKARVLVEMIARDMGELANKVGNTQLREVFLEMVRSNRMDEAGLHKQEEIISRYPELASLAVVHILPLEDIRRDVLTDGDVLLEYYQIDDGTFLAFVVNKERGVLRVEKIPLVDPDTNQRIDDLAQWLQTNCLPLSRDEASPFGSLGGFNKAYSLFLPAPIRNALDLGKEQMSLRKKRLIIVAHGLLHRLAFHALTDGSRLLSGNGTELGFKCLVDEFEKGIVYAPSATALFYCQKKEKRGVARSALILANPTCNLPSLPYAEREGRWLWRFYRPRARSFYRNRADAQALSKNAGNFDTLILLTHGLHVGEAEGDPRLSHFKLAGNSAVTVLALYILPAPTTLHDYGFCFGATVTPRAGDEFISLTRGGFYSGARSILAALWAVPDHPATVFLKTRFHKYWHACGDKGLALKRAMEETRSKEEWRDPVYWASWVLVGDWQ
jgi:tetratricopeptide (TPR) repeat protein